MTDSGWIVVVPPRNESEYYPRGVRARQLDSETLLLEFWYVGSEEPHAVLDSDVKGVRARVGKVTGRLFGLEIKLDAIPTNGEPLTCSVQALRHMAAHSKPAAPKNFSAATKVLTDEAYRASLFPVSSS